MVTMPRILLPLFISASVPLAFSFQLPVTRTILSPTFVTGSDRHYYYDHDRASSLRHARSPTAVTMTTDILHDVVTTQLSSPSLHYDLASTTIMADALGSPPPPLLPSGGSNGATVDTVVFLVGLFPFVWATVEFWRRIAVGLPFGTGKDSVVIVIGEDDAPASSRGRQTLGKGALVVAYVLFGVAAFSVGIAVYSVVTSAPPPPPV